MLPSGEKDKGGPCDFEFFPPPCTEAQLLLRQGAGLHRHPPEAALFPAERAGPMGGFARELRPGLVEGDGR